MVASKEVKKPAISFVLHAHQPLGYNRFFDINRRIYERSYLASAKLSNYYGKTKAGKDVGVSLNISGSVLLDLLAHKEDPVADGVIKEFRQANKESIEKWGATSMLLQASLFHSIVPLLPKQSQDLQNAWSLAAFRYFFGNEPSGVWLPEQAYDASALELVAQSPGQWTLLPQWTAPAGTPTSVPHNIQTSKGDITVFLYDKYLSDAISWKRAGWDFSHLIRGHNGHDKLAWLLAMDLETFGEHGRDERERKEGPWQLNNILYHQIPNEGYNSLPVQALFPLISPNELDSLSIAKNGSWSCLCKGTKEGLERELSKRGRLEAYKPYLEELPESLDGLLRWAAPCGCTNGGNFDANLWKLPFKSGLTEALKELHEIYSASTENLLKNPKEALEDYINLKLKAIDGEIRNRDVEEYELRNFRLNLVTEKRFYTILSMMEGIYHMEAAQTSCATYWESPRRLEPTYTLLHAANAFSLFEQANLGSISCESMEERLSDAKKELEHALYLADPQALATFRERQTSGKYKEHTHLDAITEKF